MTQPPGKIKFPPTLPVLTDVADEHAPDIPTLTEIYTQAEIPSDPPPFDIPLSEAACLYLTAQITPQVEALIQDALRDIQAKLPELIRSTLDKERAVRQND